ncbi:Hypothetical protein NGAL_HAMBI490_59600 [Neorhizobium galegae bv. officinalis]|nr:Hypothetical protein NGAL_HAMBI490_59600 [Neorhizobium galegae bv. officinalis]
MKIEYEVAGGHRRGDMENFIAANPALDTETAQRTWIEQRFGKWITDNITENFSIYETTPLGFRVDFPQNADALAFLRKLGGRSLETE